MNRRIDFMLAFILLVLSLSGCLATANRNTLSSQFDGPVTAITHIWLVPMTEEVVLKDQTILVAGDRIAAIGPTGEVTIPKDATIIDGKGAYLMPGLADMHVHIYEEWVGGEDYPVPLLNLYIANGVTTIRDCGTAPINPSDTFVLKWRETIRKGEMVGPTIYSSGRTIHGPTVNPGWVVRQRQTNGFDFVKLYFELSVDEFREAMAAAEELGMYTVGHIPYQVGSEMAFAAGLDEVAHIEELSFDFIWADDRPDRVLDMEDWITALDNHLANYNITGAFDPDEFYRQHAARIDHTLEDLQKYEIAVTTTLVVNEVVEQKLYDTQAFLNRPENVYLPPSLFEEVRSGQNRHQILSTMIPDYKDKAAWKNGLDLLWLQKLKEAEVLLVAASDSGSTSIGVVAGMSMHDELRILTQAGFTPYEAIQTATVNPAKVVQEMTGTGNFGVIQVGNRADLLLVGGNPLADIANTEKILGVMAAGRWYTQEQLTEMIAAGE